jgi:regulator of protease activity HflC (stomatin/prohibitin superfamily)
MYQKNKFYIAFGFGLSMIFLFLVGIEIKKDGVFDLGWMLIFGVLIYSILSIKTLAIGNKGVVTFLGKGMYPANPGPHLIPFLVCKLLVVSATNMQIEIPGEPEEVKRGVIEPMRITTADESAAIFDTVEQAQLFKDFMGKTLTVEVFAYIIIQIDDAMDFFSKFKSTKEMLGMLRDTYETEIRKAYGRRTAGYIIRNLASVNQEISEEIKRVVEEWEMKFIKCQITKTDFPHSVNIALKDAQIAEVGVGKSKDEALTTEIKAKAEKFKLKKEGEGVAAALKAKLQAEAAGKKAEMLAEAEGLKAKVQAIKSDEGKLLVQTEAFTEALHGANYSVISPDSIAHMAATFKAVTENAKVKKE